MDNFHRKNGELNGNIFLLVVKIREISGCDQLIVSYYRTGGFKHKHGSDIAKVAQSFLTTSLPVFILHTNQSA